MEFYDAYKTFEELDEKTLTERFDKSDFSTKMFLLLFLFATNEHPKTILSIAKINLPQIMRDSMHALAGYYEEFEQ